MQLWIIEDGKKSGPYEDYVLRERIRRGEISASTRVWHEGAEEWLPADQVSVLEGEFKEEVVQPLPVPQELLPPPPFLLWRRFGARWFDLILYNLIILVVFRIGGTSLASQMGGEPSFMALLLALLPPILMEGAMLGSLGWTPGKWLMNLRVTDFKGRRLSIGSSIIRSIRVWVLGMGMFQPILILLGHGIALWMGKKKGAPLWDLTTGFRVPGKELTTQRLLLFWGLLLTVVIINASLIAPDWEKIVEVIEKQQEK